MSTITKHIFSLRYEKNKKDYLGALGTLLSQRGKEKFCNSRMGMKN